MVFLKSRMYWSLWFVWWKWWFDKSKTWWSYYPSLSM